MFKLWIGFFIGFWAASLSGCYSLEQAYWFNNAFNSRVRVEDALATMELDDTARHKLLLSRQILRFASAQGLNTGDAYQHFIPPGPGTVSYLVQAAYNDRLELVTWWFPFAGKVPYLGFFEKADRDVKARHFRDEGFDISLGTVGAFSSLGWFSDPIYASMLRRKDEDFVQVLLHELVHRSFWSRGSAAFNENLAEFASLQLTETYLHEERAGVGLREFRSYREDREKFRVWISNLRDSLRELYDRNDLDHGQKMELKAKVIREFQEHRFPLLKSEELAGLQQREWNNASILGAALYAPDTERFRRAYDCLRVDRMGPFLAALRRAESIHEHVEEALDSLCPVE